jgi:hypothetical protein
MRRHRAEIVPQDAIPCRSKTGRAGTFVRGFDGWKALHLALAAPQFEWLPAEMTLGEVRRFDVVGSLDLFEADKTAVGITQQVKPVIRHTSPGVPFTVDKPDSATKTAEVT